MGGCCSGVDIDISLRDVNVSNVSNRTRSGATKPPRGRGFSLSLWRARGPRPSRYEQQFGLDDQDDARWVTTAGTDPHGMLRWAPGWERRTQGWRPIEEFLRFRE